MTFELYARQLDQEMDNFVKKKRTRRGKKRTRQRGLVNNAATTLALSLGDCAMLDPSLGNRFSDLENLPSTAGNSRDCSKIRKSRRRLLRPYYSPKAPENSTQFIMDDHCANLNLFPSLLEPGEFGKASHCDFSIDYKSFVLCDELMGRELVHQVPEAYVYDNSSFDNSVAEFMQDDFEQVFRIARENELNEMSREDLIRALFELEQKLDKYNSSTFTLTSERHMGGASQIKVENQHIQEENERLQSAIDGIRYGPGSCK